MIARRERERERESENVAAEFLIGFMIYPALSF